MTWTVNNFSWWMAPVLALLSWRVVARFRRMVGRQRLSKYRIWIHLTLFPSLMVIVAATGIRSPGSAFYAVLGLSCGALLGIYGLRTTTFAPEPGKLYYTPNPYLGVALSLMFVLRLAYRGFELATASSMSHGGAVDFLHSSWTIGVFACIAAYYTVYALGLRRWRLRLLAAKRQRELGAPDPT